MFSASCKGTVAKMTEEIKFYQIDQDDLGGLDGAPVFVTFGETMVRETPADME